MFETNAISKPVLYLDLKTLSTIIEFSKVDTILNPVSSKDLKLKILTMYYVSVFKSAPLKLYLAKILL